MNLNNVAGRIRKGETVMFTAHGDSMRPIIRSGDKVTVRPINEHEPLAKNDIVLAKVKGRLYLHKISAVNVESDTVQISNNKGHVNGWTSRHQVIGKLVQGDEPKFPSPEFDRAHGIDLQTPA